MEYTPSFADSLQADIKPSYSDSLIHEFDDKKFGLPKAKKYPMPDVAHVRSAIKFFNYVDRAHEKELAKAILARMHEYGIDPSDINVGDTNRFKKYLPKTELKHHGIKGMHWGVRRFENYDGTLTPAGKRRYEGMDRKSQKAKKQYLKTMKRDMDEHFKSQISPNARKYAHIGVNGHEQMGSDWSSAYSKGLVTSRDADQIRKAARETRAYMSKKYGESATKALTKSNQLFRKIDDFDTI